MQYYSYICRCYPLSKYYLFMKTGTSIILLLYLSIGILHGQQTDADKGLPGKLMQDYFSAAQEYALIYNGKEYSRYEKQTTNHPYLVNAEFEEGTISSGKTLYPRLLMKLDLFRDELVLQSPKKLYPGRCRKRPNRLYPTKRLPHYQPVSKRMARLDRRRICSITIR